MYQQPGPVGSQATSRAVSYTHLQIEGDGKAKRCTVTDELDELRELQDTDFTIM